MKLVAMFLSTALVVPVFRLMAAQAAVADDTAVCGGLCGDGSQSSCIAVKNPPAYVCPPSGTTDTKITNINAAIKNLEAMINAQNTTSGNYYPLPDEPSFGNSNNGALNQLNQDFGIADSGSCTPENLQYIGSTLRIQSSDKTNTKVDGDAFLCVTTTKNLLLSIKQCFCPTQRANSSAKNVMRMSNVKESMKNAVVSAMD